jgi:hypothetical protein
MIDEKTKKKIQKKIPEGVSSLFIASITKHGLVELKDLIWKTLHE